MIDYDWLHFQAIRILTVHNLQQDTLTADDPVYLEYRRLQVKLKGPK